MLLLTDAREALLPWRGHLRTILAGGDLIMPTKQLSIYLLVLTIAVLSGCTSISKGITQAYLEHETEDTRECWITGRSFDGLDDLFETENEAASATGEPDQLKILMVHGIGNHAPGYSRRLQDGLVEEYGFETTDETIKTIAMRHPAYPDTLGVLRVHRYMTRQSSQEMLFYELTWDSIVAKETELLSFDYSTEASVKRAPFNHTLKTLINNTVPDALMYNTKYRQPIQLSVAQAMCWILSEQWDNLPNNQEISCDINRPNYMSQLDQSKLAIISHSLGSRISLDALQASFQDVINRPRYQAVSASLRSKQIHLYMLSNQLPLLQVGQELPEVHDQGKSFCRSEGDKYDERFIEKLQIVAFSDPNDLFSYAVSPEYANRYIDSRLCPAVSNVTIHIAQVRSFLLGASEVANPLVAHSDYEIDSRVLKMLVSGFGTDHGQEEVKERCEFIESIPDY
jgi:hypothetical protein